VDIGFGPIAANAVYEATDSTGTVDSEFDVPTQDSYKPSYSLHGGQRVFVGGRDVTGSNGFALTAVDEDGNERTLYQQAPNIPTRAYWGKDDNSVTMLLETDDATTGGRRTDLYWSGVTWGTDGMPTLAAAPQRILTGAHSGDWSADGTQMVYDDNGTVYVASFNTGGATPAHTGTASLASGSWGEWSPVSGSTAIAYINSSDELARINSDGTGGQQLTSNSGSKDFKGFPTWSPEGQHVLYRLMTQRRMFRTQVYVSSLHIVGSSGGSITDVGLNDGDVYHVRGWRD